MKSEVHKVYRAVDHSGEVYYIVVEEVSDMRSMNQVAFFALSPHREMLNGTTGDAWIYANADGKSTLDDIIRDTHFGEVEDTGLNIIDLFKIIEEKRNGNVSG